MVYELTLPPCITVHVVNPVCKNQSLAAPVIHENIGGSKCSKIVSGHGSLFHYETDIKLFPGTVKKLTFEQLGSYELPNLQHFSNTCESLEFKGKIYSGRTVFEITHQLPKVNSVDIFIDSSQVDYQGEEFKYEFRTPLCKNVTKLKISMDREYFYSNFNHQCDEATSFICVSEDCFTNEQRSLVLFVENLLKNAGSSFPNLKSLIIELPENVRLCKAVKSLIDLCPALKKTICVSLRNGLLSVKAADDDVIIDLDDISSRLENLVE